MEDDIFYYDKVETQDTFLNKLKRVATSTFLFSLAYLVANLVHQLLLGLLCVAHGYQTKIGFQNVSAQPYDYAYWNSAKVLFIYGTTPFACLVFAFIIYKLILGNQPIINRIRVFWLWLYFNFIIIFLVQLFIIPLGATHDNYAGFYKTFAIVAKWFKVPVVGFYATSVIALVIPIILGYFIAPQIHRFSFSSRFIQTLNGKNVIVAQVYLLPILIAVTLVLGLSNTTSILLHLFTYIFFLLPIIGIYICHRLDRTTPRCQKSDVLNHWPLLEFALLMALGTLVYLFLNR